MGSLPLMLNLLCDDGHIKKMEKNTLVLGWLYIPQEQKRVDNSLMILNSWNSKRTIMYSLGSDASPQLQTTPFIFLCVFWRISPSRRTLGHHAKGAPQFYTICFHVPMKIFATGKRHWNEMRVVFVRGGSHTCSFSWSWGTPWGSCPGVPHPQENTFVQEPPQQHDSNTNHGFQNSHRCSQNQS